MIQVKTVDYISSKINTGEAVLIYFSGENCSVCSVLKSKIEQEISKNFPKIQMYEVKAELYKQVASHFTVFSIPTILVFFDKKRVQKTRKKFKCFFIYKRA